MNPTEAEIKAQKIKKIRQKIVGMALIKMLKQCPDENIHIKYEKESGPNA